MSQTGLGDFSNIVGFYAPFSNLSDISPARAILSINHYSQNITLNEINTSVNNSLNRAGARIIESNQIILSGNPAHKIVYLAIGNKLLKLETMLVWTMKDNNLYTIAFSAVPAKYSTYVPMVQRMINTFEITNSTVSHG